MGSSLRAKSVKDLASTAHGGLGNALAGEMRETGGLTTAYFLFLGGLPVVFHARRSLQSFNSRR
jgi:hypothetical protein